MQLLVAVINHEECVEDILSGFVEIGVTGATLLDSRGMGRVLSKEVPIFAGVDVLAAASRPANKTLFCIVDDTKLEAAMRILQETCGSFERPGAGILFTVPVSHVVGLKPELR